MNLNALLMVAGCEVCAAISFHMYDSIRRIVNCIQIATLAIMWRLEYKCINGILTIAHINNGENAVVQRDFCVAATLSPINNAQIRAKHANRLPHLILGRISFVLAEDF